jgi:hypothetical protein
VFTRIKNSAPSATKYCTWQSDIVCTSSPVPYLTRHQNPEESPDQGSGGSPMYQRLGCLRQRYQTPRTQRPPEIDHQTSSGQLPATVPPQQALVGCTQRTSNSHHNQILAIRRMGAYPWEHHQQPPRPTIWIEWRQDPPCEEAPVGVKVWAGYAYLERGVQQLTWSTATL